jgi:drug/metabolite transporter (DMT)-like permease
MPALSSMTHSSPAISPLQGTLAGIVPCLIWSSAVLVMNRLSAPFGPLRAAGLELGMAGALLVVAAMLRGNLALVWAHPLRCHLVCGLFWLLNLTLSWLAFANVNSSGELLVAGLLNYLWPSLTLLLAIPILEKRATWPLFPGLVAVCAGLIIGKVATAPPEATSEALMHINPLAYTLAVLDAFAWALYSNFSRKLSNPHGASAVPLYMLVTSALMLTVSSYTEQPHHATTPDYLLLICWSVATALAYLFWDVGMRFGNVVTISILSMFIPLLSTIITAIMSGHGISALLILSAALVVIGSSICRKGVI